MCAVVDGCVHVVSVISSFRRFRLTKFVNLCSVSVPIEEKKFFNNDLCFHRSIVVRVTIASRLGLWLLSCKAASLRENGMYLFIQKLPEFCSHGMIVVCDVLFTC